MSLTYLDYFFILTCFSFSKLLHHFIHFRKNFFQEETSKISHPLLQNQLPHSWLPSHFYQKFSIAPPPSQPFLKSWKKGREGRTMEFRRDHTNKNLQKNPGPSFSRSLFNFENRKVSFHFRKIMKRFINDLWCWVVSYVKRNWANERMK